MDDKEQVEKDEKRIKEMTIKALDILLGNAKNKGEIFYALELIRFGVMMPKGSPKETILGETNKYIG